MSQPIDLKNRRNFGIVAHVDSGKTTLTERILYYTGRKKTVGEVHDGETVTDYLKAEKERGITIQSAAVSVPWSQYQYSIIDTPGHADFTVEVQRSLRVMDGIIMLMDSVAGVEPQTKVVWAQSRQYNIPALFFVNKMDRLGANFDKCVKQIRSSIKSNSCPITYPVFENDVFVGFIDLTTSKKYIWDDNSLNTSATVTDIELDENLLQKRIDIIEEVVTDTHIEYYLEHGNLPNDIFIECLKDAVRSCKFVPILCGSAFKNKGVEFLLDAVGEYLPYPSIPEEQKDQLSAICFKNINDRFFGNVTYVRIYNGYIRLQEYIYNNFQEKRERPTKIVQLQANKFVPVDYAGPGEVVGLIGMKHTFTGHTLSTTENKHNLESIKDLVQVISLSVKPNTEKDKTLLSKCIAKTSMEDPSIRFSYDETGTLIISGMGELHLEVVIDRWNEETGVNLTIGEPTVDYLEKFIGKHSINYTHKKQKGGAGQWAYIEITFESIDTHEVIFESKLVGTSIPREYVPSVEEGFRKQVKEGYFINKPIVGIKATLTGGSYHSVDSSTLAFEICCKEAFKEILEKTKPCILEPYVNLDIQTPSEYTGDIIKDISRRRGEIKEVVDTEGNSDIYTETPVANLFKYVSYLRSLTKGSACPNMFFSCYKPMTDDLIQGLLRLKQEKNQ